jgi:hypothetical protein
VFILGLVDSNRHLSAIQTDNGRKAQVALEMPDDLVTPMDVAIDGMVGKVRAVAAKLPKQMLTPTIDR